MPSREETPEADPSHAGIPLPAALEHLGVLLEELEGAAPTKTCCPHKLEPDE